MSRYTTLKKFYIYCKNDLSKIDSFGKNCRFLEIMQENYSKIPLKNNIYDWIRKGCSEGIFWNKVELFVGTYPGRFRIIQFENTKFMLFTELSSHLKEAFSGDLTAVSFRGTVWMHCAWERSEVLRTETSSLISVELFNSIVSKKQAMNSAVIKRGNSLLR